MGQFASDAMLAGVPAGFYVRLPDPTSDIPLLLDLVWDDDVYRVWSVICSMFRWSSISQTSTIEHASIFTKYAPSCPALKEGQCNT
jgi:hypothetical protein